MMMDWVITLDGVEFDTLAHVEDADYSWNAEAVLRRKSDGAMFYVEDGGCSCNSFGDYLTIADLKPIWKIEEAYRMTSDRERLQRSFETREVQWRE